jgi:hypothetical protein
VFEDIFVTTIDQISGSLFDIGSAMAVGLFGWYFAYTIGNMVTCYFDKTNLIKIIKQLGWENPIVRFCRAGIAVIFGKAVEIWIILFFLMFCSGILQLEQLSLFLRGAVMYFLNIFVAFAIFAAAAVLADFIQRSLVSNLGKGKLVHSRLLAKFASGIICALAVLAILYQLKIIAPLALAIFVGIVIMVSIASGVALGWGGKDLAAKILKEIEGKLK